MTDSPLAMFDELADQAIRDEILRRAELKAQGLIQAMPWPPDDALTSEIRQLALCFTLLDALEEWDLPDLPADRVQRLRRMFRIRIEYLLNEGVTPIWQGIMRQLLLPEVTP